MSARRHDLHAVPAALVPVLLVAGVTACGDAEQRPRAKATAAVTTRTATPTVTPTATPADATATATAAPEPRLGRPVTHAALVRRMDGRRLRVGDGRVRIDAATLTCGGIGRGRRVHGERAWRRFRCIQPTFPAGAVAGPDAVFVVASTARRGLVVTERRLVGY